MKIELPLETWVDIFGFVPQSQLKQLVPQPHIEFVNMIWNVLQKRKETINDRQFVSVVQFFLHKCGEVTLGNLHITLPTFGNEPIVIVNKEYKMPLADADEPIPQNIRNFKSILISNFHPSAIAFLQKFQQNSLLTNANIYINSNFLSTVNALPLFTNININSIEIDCYKSTHLLEQLQYNRDYSGLANPMLASARVLLTHYNCRDVWFCDWLHIPREDGRPRVLLLCGCYKYGLYALAPFTELIKKNFLAAKQAVSFFIKLPNFHDDFTAQLLTLENHQTHEKLVIRGKTGGHDYVSISRYSMGTNEDEWLEDQRPNIGNRKIELTTRNGEYYYYTCIDI